MTEDRLPLTELLQKSGEGDFLRSIAESVLQLLMAADVEGAGVAQDVDGVADDIGGALLAFRASRHRRVSRQAKQNIRFWQCQR